MAATTLEKKVPEPNWATPLVTLLEALKQGPYAAMLGIGLLLMVAAFITQLGDYKITSTAGSQGTMIIFGSLLIGIAILGPVVGAARRDRVRADSTPYPLPPEASNLNFMFQLFYFGMPPAFVKRVDDYDEATGVFQSYDILYSKAFDMFQDASELQGALQAEDEAAVVYDDHKEGDRRALKAGTVGRCNWSIRPPCACQF